MGVNQSWKNLEREAGKILGGKRRCRMGNWAVSDSDVIHDIFEIECKKRNTIYPFNVESLKSLNEANLYNRRKGNKKIPLGICQTTGKPLKLCYMTVRSLLALIKYKLLEDYGNTIVGIELESLGRIYKNDREQSKSEFIGRCIPGKKFGKH